MEHNHASQAFVRELRRALRRLYDPAGLRKSPLLESLAIDTRHNPVSALRQVLVDAIQALKPGDDVPLHSNACRIHRVLTYRYVQQFVQKEVAASLGLSIRQLAREENVAVQVLADYLLTHCDVQLRGHDSSTTSSQAEDQVAPPPATTPAQKNELEWLRESLPREIADIAGMIRTALKTIGPLMQASSVQVECEVLERLPLVAGQPTTMRQALLSLLTAAVRSVPGGRVKVAVETDQKAVRVHVWAAADPAASSPIMGGLPVEHLKMTRQLVSLSGGTLEVLPTLDREQPLVATLVLPVAEQVPVLVIDDNADTLHLLQRYLFGTRYGFTGTRDPGQALALAEELAVQIIVLDVMLPGIDGWELLGRLREHPKTRSVPVVVCTILPQEQLALALGAAAFIHKPVSREVLLSALDQQMGLPLSESR
jgi:CheY-like chemotaxis protein